MNCKDDRHKTKRFNMKQKKSIHRKSSNGNGSSASQVEVLRGVIDVADSSDDRFSMRPLEQWSPRVIESELEIDMENEQMHAADFGMLSQVPPSIGGHFQFSSEKSWDTDDVLIDKSEAGEYFTLNLNLLNAGLQTIPFYKRLDFPSSWFTKSQVNAMNQAAEIAENNYQSILNDHESNPKGKQNSASRKASAKSTKNPVEPNRQETTTPGNNTSDANEKDQELDELLNLTSGEVAKGNIDTSIKTESKTSRPPSAKSDIKATDGAETKDGIQQWLDDVLEE